MVPWAHMSQPPWNGISNGSTLCPNHRPVTPHGGKWIRLSLTPFNTQFLKPTWVSPQMASQVFSHFCHLSSTQTHRPRYVWHLTCRACQSASATCHPRDLPNPSSSWSPCRTPALSSCVLRHDDCITRKHTVVQKNQADVHCGSKKVPLYS